MDFDPAKVSYQRLVDFFFSAHDPTRPPYKRQYMAAIFTHGAEQEHVARTVMARVQERLDKPIQTQILPAGEFYLAEDYHQKYALQGNPILFQEFQAMYPDFWDIVDSPAATRVNAYLYGYGKGEQLAAELDSLGLSDRAGEALRQAGPAAACPVP